MLRYIVGSMFQVAIGATSLLHFASRVGPPAAAAADAGTSGKAASEAAGEAAHSAASEATSAAKSCVRCRNVKVTDILAVWESQTQQQQQHRASNRPLLAPAAGLLLQKVHLLPGLHDALFPSTLKCKEGVLAVAACGSKGQGTTRQPFKGLNEESLGCSSPALRAANAQGNLASSPVRISEVAVGGISKV
ncbi:uncharacterized protein LOC113146922 [Cyclospora cayetanensis]|uniref:Uncharacterized protein LOC113146922 n=1 Tax=Cyclospora cayetanensis TaxID=88456 RepID=A0A6P6RUI9_9EIME|nr:uncharacterized protein LOC113146922 [Cyclospora cayetanensis]